MSKCGVPSDPHNPEGQGRHHCTRLHVTEAQRGEVIGPGHRVGKWESLVRCSPLKPGSCSVPVVGPTGTCRAEDGDTCRLQPACCNPQGLPEVISIPEAPWTSWPSLQGGVGPPPGFSRVAMISDTRPHTYRNQVSVAFRHPTAGTRPIHHCLLAKARSCHPPPQ